MRFHIWQWFAVTFALGAMLATGRSLIEYGYDMGYNDGIEEAMNSEISPRDVPLYLKPQNLRQYFPGIKYDY